MTDEENFALSVIRRMDWGMESSPRRLWISNVVPKGRMGEDEAR